jgi:uncharacterized protein (DUF1684 family)
VEVTDVNEWVEKLEHQRKEKDIFFAMHQQSPIPLEERLGFMGLSYYPITPDFRFELELHEHSNKETIQIEDTQRNIRQFLRWGEFRFKVGSEQYSLQCYKNAPEEERLFIPFRDTTSGKETYGAGRYLDIDSGDLTTNGKWILDFNEAYNPWCAYSENYACPFVPPENWLKVPIKAGEKNYPPDTEEE